MARTIVSKPQAKVLPTNGKDIIEDGEGVTIKDVVVADPSIEFSIYIDPEVHKPVNGIYFVDFTVQMSISDLDPKNPGVLTPVGAIKVNTVSQTNPYFYFSFGDPDYKAGTKFTLCLVLSAYHPSTGVPIEFKPNPVFMEVYGGGEAR
ncbi:MAG: hypothetical protein ACOYXT_28145 [Bacteroidota bacterium]